MAIGHVRRAAQQRLRMTRRRSACDASIHPSICGSMRWQVYLLSAHPQSSGWISDAADCQVELLRGRDLVVDENHVHGLLLAQEAQLLPLPGSEVRPRLEPGALLREPAGDLETQRLRELAQLGQRSVELEVAHAGPLHGRDDGALRLRVDIL